METKVVNKKTSNEFDIYIGRGSVWGNPYTSKPLANTKAKYQADSRYDSIRKYKKSLVDNPQLVREIPQLKGKTLACYCAPMPCHGEILAMIADFFSFIFNTGIEVKVKDKDKIGTVLKNPRESFLYDCNDLKCFALHIKIRWNDGTETIECVSSLKKENENEATLQRKQKNLFEI